VTDLVPPSGVVHWLGAGMSTGSGRGLVCETVALKGELHVRD